MKYLNPFYPKLKIQQLFYLPIPLVHAMHKAFNRRYADFYLDDGTDDAEEAIGQVLQAFSQPLDHLAHQRLVCMGTIMALATRSTFEYYKINDNRVDMVLNKAIKWLDTNDLALVPEPVEGRQAQEPVGLAKQIFFDHETVRENESLNDAYYLYFHFLNSLTPDSAYDSTMEILYVSLLGDAISAQPEERRNLFNWWLNEVVPLAYLLQLPLTFGFGNQDAHLFGSDLPSVPSVRLVPIAS